MIKLLMIADDFTGALDTGIQFVKKGIKTQVMVGTSIDPSSLSDTTKVLVVDSETRPMTRQEAYDTVLRIARQAKEMGVETIYKKTDSALRGNVGSELSAAADGFGEERVYFIPAFPDVNRITREGIHYINGVKLEESGFGKDPFDPMTCSYVPAILAGQTEKKIVLVKQKDRIPKADQTSEIVVFDAETNEEMKQRIREIKEQGGLKLLAGCAGFAACLPEELGLEGTYAEKVFRTEHFVVACGSLNPITKAQVEYAQEKGFYRCNLMPQQKLCMQYYQTEEGKQFLRDLGQKILEKKRVELDTFDLEGRETTLEYAKRTKMDPDAIRFAISGCYGKIVRDLAEQEMDMTVLMTGGDTLMGFMKEIGVNQISPVEEVGQGTVLSRLYWKDRVIQVISKSGGYGEKEVFVKAADRLVKE